MSWAWGCAPFHAEISDFTARYKRYPAPNIRMTLNSQTLDIIIAENPKAAAMPHVADPTITPDASLSPMPRPWAIDVPEIVTDLPQTAEPETAQQTDRVAPEPVQAPEPDTQVDDVAQEEVAPDEGADANQPVQEATAPEAASDRIVTEAEADDAEPTAPLASVRPLTRPARPSPEPEQPPETQTATAEENSDPAPEPNPEVESSAVDDALAEALAGSGEVEAPEPSGPPMTRGEKDALRIAVSQCWNVGSLSSEALRTSVVVGVTLSREGVPDIGSIRMLSSSGGSDSSAKQAYEAARRAIIRCGSRGFDLPADKFAQWRDIEMTFNPEGMRIR